jgi:hypothetical protein
LARRHLSASGEGQGDENHNEPLMQVHLAEIGSVKLRVVVLDGARACPALRNPDSIPKEGIRRPKRYIDDAWLIPTRFVLSSSSTFAVLLHVNKSSIRLFFETIH